MAFRSEKNHDHLRTNAGTARILARLRGGTFPVVQADAPIGPGARIPLPSDDRHHILCLVAARGAFGLRWSSLWRRYPDIPARHRGSCAVFGGTASSHLCRTLGPSSHRTRVKAFCRAPSDNCRGCSEVPCGLCRSHASTKLPL